MNKQDHNHMLPYEYDKHMETEKWAYEIPFIQFPADWQVQITPPFRGATIRFTVKKGKAHVSVYLDCYDRLGCCGQPYWEVYPHKQSAYRCYLNETNQLLKAIEESLELQNNKEQKTITFEIEFDDKPNCEPVYSILEKLGAFRDPDIPFAKEMYINISSISDLEKLNMQVDKLTKGDYCLMIGFKKDDTPFIILKDLGS